MPEGEDWTAEDERTARLTDLFEEHEGDSFSVFYEPGRLGFHEVVDRLKTVVQFIDMMILSHPAALLRPDIFKEMFEVCDQVDVLADKLIEDHVSKWGVDPEDAPPEFRDPFDGPAEEL